MRGKRECNLRVGEFVLLDIIKWERVDDRTSDGVEGAIFFGGSRRIEKSRGGACGGSVWIDIPYFSFGSPARNRSGKVGRLALTKATALWIWTFLVERSIQLETA